MAEKMVSQATWYTAKIEIRKEQKLVVNPNGRGYDEDNVTRHINGNVMEFTIRAATAEHLTEKVQVILGTIGENE